MGASHDAPHGWDAGNVGPYDIREDGMLDDIVFAYERQTDRLALASDAESVACWTIPSEGGQADPDLTLETSRSQIQGMAFIDADRLLTVHELGSIVLWALPSSDGDETSPEAVWSRMFALEPCAFACSAHDTKEPVRVAVGDRRGRLVLLTFGTGDDPDIGVAEAHETDVTELTFTPGADRLASAGRDRLIRVWSTALDAAEQMTLASSPTEAIEGPGSDEHDEIESGEGPPPESAPDAQQPPPDSAPEDAPDPPPSEAEAGEEVPSPEAQTPEAARGESVRGTPLESITTLEGAQGWPLTLTFEGDGRERLAAGVMDNGVYLWDLREGSQPQSVIVQHNNWITDLKWSPDDTHLASGSWDATVGLFRAEGLEPTYRFELHSDFVSSVHFVPETDMLVSASYDGSLAFWNWRQGELESHLSGHNDWIETLHPLDNDRLATISSDGTVRIWSISERRAIARLGEAVERFDLGRGVDFSNYLDIESLATDRLPDPEETASPMDAVHRLGQESGSGDQSEGTAQTAVGLLEDAIDESERGEGREPGTIASEGEEDQAPSTDDSAKLLEAQLEEHEIEIETQAESVESPNQEGEPRDGEPAESSGGGELADGDLEPDNIDVSSSSEKLEDRIRDVAEQDVDLVSADMEVGDEDDEEASLDLTDAPPSQDETSGGATDQGSVEPDLSADSEETPSTEEDEDVLEPDVSVESSGIGTSDTGSSSGSTSSSDTTASQDAEGRSSSGRVTAESPAPAEPTADDTSDEDGNGTDVTPSGEGDEVSTETLPAEETSSPGSAESGSEPSAQASSDEQDVAPEEPERGRPPGTSRDSGETGASSRSTAPGTPADTSAPEGLNASEQTIQEVEGGSSGSGERGAPPTPSEKDDTAFGDAPRTSTETADSVDDGEDGANGPEEDGALPPPSNARNTADMQSVEDDTDVETEEESESTSGPTREGPNGESHTTEPMGAEMFDEGEASASTSERRPEGNEPRSGTEPMRSMAGGAEASSEATSNRDEAGERVDTQRMGSLGGSDDNEGDDTDASPSSSSGTGTQKMGTISSPGSHLDTGDDAGGDGPHIPTPAEVDVPEEETEDHASDGDDAEDRLQERLSRLKDRAGGDDADSTTSSSDERASRGGDASSETSNIHDTTASELWEERPHPGRAMDDPAEANETTSSPDEAATPADATFEESHTFRTPHGWVYSVAQQPGGSLVATCGGNGDVCLWSPSGRKRHALPTQSDGLNEVVFSPDGRIVAAAGDDTRLHLWLLPKPSNSDRLESIRHTKLDDHDSWVTSVSVDPSGRRLMTGSYDGTARLWALEDGRCLAVLEGHETPVSDVAFAEGRAVTVSHGGRVDIWSQSGDPIQAFEGYDKISSVDATADHIIWTSESGAVYLHDGIATRELQSHREEARDATIDDGALATVGADGRVYLYPPGETKADQVLRADAPLWCIHQRGHRVTVGDDEGRISVYEQ